MMDPARCARVGLWFCAAVALLVSGNAQPDTLANAQFISVPRVELPEYLVPTVDASLGTTSVRVTAPGVSMGNGVACEPSYCTHRYSSAQAWNADQSLLLIANGCNGLCFLDGQTYAPLFLRHRAGECEWHPQDPDLMICMTGHRISRWAPRRNTEELI